jgi:hypothetical protein
MSFNEAPHYAFICVRVLAPLSVKTEGVMSGFNTKKGSFSLWKGNGSSLIYDSDDSDAREFKKKGK